MTFRKSLQIWTGGTRQWGAMDGSDGGGARAGMDEQEGGAAMAGMEIHGPSGRKRKRSMTVPAGPVGDAVLHLGTTH